MKHKTKCKFHKIQKVRKQAKEYAWSEHTNIMRHPHHSTIPYSFLPLPLLSPLIDHNPSFSPNMPTIFIPNVQPNLQKCPYYSCMGLVAREGW